MDRLTERLVLFGLTLDIERTLLGEVVRFRLVFQARLCTLLRPSSGSFRLNWWQIHALQVVSHACLSAVTTPVVSAFAVVKGVWEAHRLISLHQTGNRLCPRVNTGAYKILGSPKFIHHVCSIVVECLHYCLT